MKERACCFTGHRNILQEHNIPIQRVLTNVIFALASRGISTFYTGGARGFDTFAALSVISAKRIFPNIQLILALPYRDQARNWNDADIYKYELIKKLADKTLYISEKYQKGCYFKRNRYMVDHSCFCVSYLFKKTGGTKYTVDYCKEKGIPVYNIHEQLSPEMPNFPI